MAAAQATYAGNPVTIADGAIAHVPWDVLQSGHDLLDRSDPANAKVLAAGVYAVTAIVRAATLLSPGGYATCVLALGNNVEDASSVVPVEPDIVGDLTCTALLAKGDLIFVQVANRDGGGASRDYGLQLASVVKVT